MRALDFFAVEKSVDGVKGEQVKEVVIQLTDYIKIFIQIKRLSVFYQYVVYPGKSI